MNGTLYLYNRYLQSKMISRLVSNILLTLKAIGLEIINNKKSPNKQTKHTVYTYTHFNQVVSKSTFFYEFNFVHVCERSKTSIEFLKIPFNSSLHTRVTNFIHFV